MSGLIQVRNDYGIPIVVSLEEIETVRVSDFGKALIILANGRKIRTQNSYHDINRTFEDFKNNRD